MAKLKTIARWFLQVLLGAMFVVLGVAKFLAPEWERNFARWGYPPGFHLVIGALEVLGGLGLLMPYLASYAAGGLMAIMVGAVLTHLLHDEMRRAAGPIPHFVLLGILALARWSQARRWYKPSQ